MARTTFFLLEASIVLPTGWRIAVLLVTGLAAGRPLIFGVLTYAVIAGAGRSSSGWRCGESNHRQPKCSARPDINGQAAQEARAITSRFDSCHFILHTVSGSAPCCVLGQTGDFEFFDLQEMVGVSDRVLSKQVAVLMDAGYVKQRRGIRGSRQRVWHSLSSSGKAAFRGRVHPQRASVGDCPVTSAVRVACGRRSA